MNPFSLNIDYSKRIFGLDVFRAIAIILVVLTHGSYLLNGTFMEGFPYVNLPDGVDLFFVLSGFLIGTILLKEAAANGRLSFKDLLKFWKRRWFRTLPNYYLILFANWFIVKHQIIKEDFSQFNYKFLIFSQNLTKPFYGFFWESWSLSVEEWFYILSPLLLSALLIILPVKRAFLLTGIIMILFPLLHRISISTKEVDPFWFDVTFRKVVATRLDTIGYGIFAAWFCYYYNHLWYKLRHVLFTSGLILLTAIIYNGYEPSQFYAKTIMFSLLPFSIMMLLPYAESKSTMPGSSVLSLIGRGLTFISIISYSMYLINNALVAEVIRDNFPPSSAADSLFKYGIYWLVVILGSTLLYKYFEKPMMDLRDRKKVAPSTLSDSI